MINPIQLRFRTWCHFIGRWCKVQRVLVHQLVLQLLRVLLRKRHVSILVVQAHLSERLEVDVGPLAPLLLLLLVVVRVVFYA